MATLEHGSLSLNSLANSLGNLDTRKKTYNRTTSMIRCQWDTVSSYENSARDENKGVMDCGYWYRFGARLQVIIVTLINEEVLLLAKCLKNEKQNWIPRALFLD